jgi:exonuclease III
MRLVTWNACRGSFEFKAPLVLALKPDIAVIQEIAKPQTEIAGCQWFGDNPRQGVAVIVSVAYRLHLLPMLDDVPKFVVPIVVSGPHSFLLMAVWTLGNQPMRYVRAASSAVEAYKDLFASERVVMLGDFNSNAIWDRLHPRRLNHSALVERLAGYGLVSAYHHVHGIRHGQERESTFHQYRHKDKPYHIDYCFLPLTWAHSIKNVELGAYSTWAKHSDHLPLTVELDASVV